MANVSPTLVAFVVDLVADEATRQAFFAADAAGRDQQMAARGLTAGERRAVLEGDVPELRRRLNIQVVMARKAPTGAARKKAAKKKAAKKR